MLCGSESVLGDPEVRLGGPRSEVTEVMVLSKVYESHPDTCQQGAAQEGGYGAPCYTHALIFHIKAYNLYQYQIA